MKKYIEEMSETLSQIRNDHIRNLHTIENKLKKIIDSSSPCLAYFTNAIFISSNEENVIIGKFHILNTGYQTIHQPIILLSIKSELEVKFSGKFASSEGKGDLGLVEWERVKTNGDTRKEYCLKPVKINELQMGESAAFSDFQLKFQYKENHSISLEGYVYFEEMPEGIRSLNSINLSM